MESLSPEVTATPSASSSAGPAITSANHLVSPSPKISIVIPTYNNSHFLPETLASVFSQNYADYEIIIVDDGSTDDTAVRLQAYGDRIRYVYQENAGSAKARNKGLDLARGQYVVFLDADDLLLPGKLKEQAAFLDIRPSLGMVHSGWQEIDEDGRLLRTIEPWHAAPVLDLETWFKQKPIRMGAMMYRRLWLESVGGLDPTIRQSHDVDLMLRLVLAGCTAEWMYKPTMSYRYYANSTIRRNARRQHGYIVRVVTKFLGLPNLPENIRQMGSRIRYYNLRWVAWHMYESGFPEAVISPLEQGFLYSPRSTERTAVEIAERFLLFLVADGRPPQELETLMPYIKRAGHISDRSWQLIERFLRWWLAQWPASQKWANQNTDSLWQLCYNLMQKEAEMGIPMETIASWWVDVWSWYLFATRPSSLQAFAPFAHLPLPTLLEMSQLCLVSYPDAVNADVIDRFWADLKAAGLVPKGKGGAVAALHLSYFGQQLLGRRWRQAVPPLLRASEGLLSPAGWQAWAGFAQAGSHYYPIGLQPQPHLLLGATPAFPDEHLVSLLASCRQAGWLVSAAAGQKTAVYPLGLAESDWLPAEALSRLARAKPANHGRFLRQMRPNNGRMGPYRRLPLMGRPWHLIYLDSFAEAVAHRPIFACGYPILLRVQGAEDGLAAGKQAQTILKEVTAVHCTSASAYAWLLQQGVPAAKIYHIEPGIDTDFFVPLAKERAEGEPWRLLLAANLDWRAGGEYLLLALARLLETGTAVSLDVVGDGPDYERLLYTAHDLQIETAVRFHKQVDRPTLRHFLQAADLFVAPQLQDGVSFELLAAMATGLPIVAHDLPSLRAALGNGQYGRLVTPRQPDALAGALWQLMNHDEQRQQLATAVRQQAVSAFPAQPEQTAVLKMLRNLAR